MSISDDLEVNDELYYYGSNYTFWLDPDERGHIWPSGNRLVHGWRGKVVVVGDDRFGVWPRVKFPDNKGSVGCSPNQLCWGWPPPPFGGVYALADKVVYTGEDANSQDGGLVHGQQGEVMGAGTSYERVMVMYMGIEHEVNELLTNLCRPGETFNGGWKLDDQPYLCGSDQIGPGGVGFKWPDGDRLHGCRGKVTGKDGHGNPKVQFPDDNRWGYGIGKLTIRGFGVSIDETPHGNGDAKLLAKIASYYWAICYPNQLCREWPPPQMDGYDQSDRVVYNGEDANSQDGGLVHGQLGVVVGAGRTDERLFVKFSEGPSHQSEWPEYHCRLTKLRRPTAEERDAFLEAFDGYGGSSAMKPDNVWTIHGWKPRNQQPAVDVSDMQPAAPALNLDEVEVALGDEARVHAKSKGKMSDKLSAKLSSLASSAEERTAAAKAAATKAAEEKAAAAKTAAAKTAAAKTRVDQVRATIQQTQQGLPYRRGRLGILGASGSGKTATQRALTGQPFDPRIGSTVGAESHLCELDSRQVRMQTDQGGHRMMSAYERRAHEHTEALAAATQQRLDGHAASTDKKASYMIEGVRAAAAAEKAEAERKAEAAEEKASQVASQVALLGAGGGIAQRDKTDSDEVFSVWGWTGRLGTQSSAGSSALKPASSSDRVATQKASDSSGASDESVAVEAEPEPEMHRSVMELLSKNERFPSKVLTVHDTGGQDIFGLLRHMLGRASSNSVDLVVFSLTALKTKETDTLETLRRFLHELALHGTASTQGAERRDILLVGTHKDDVGEKEVSKMSKLLHLELSTCPAFRRVRHNNAESLWLHAIENSRSSGALFDTSIQQLAIAIDNATDELPAMTELVPPRWLKVVDQIKAKAAEKQHLSLSDVETIARKCNLPHTGLTMDTELHAMLHFFHSLGTLLWFDTPSLRSLVIVDLQWLVNAVGRLIRDHKGVHSQDLKTFEDEACKWNLLKQWTSFLGSARLTPALLDKVLWGTDQRFANHCAELREIVISAGLVVPLRKDGELLVPSLLSGTEAFYAPDDALVCCLHFALCAAERPAALRTHEQLRDGFLPIGAYHHLCASLMAWHQRTVYGVAGAPKINRDHIQIRIAKNKLVMSLDLASNCVIVRLNKASQERASEAGSLFALRARLKLLVQSMLSEHFASLQYSLLVAWPTKRRDDPPIWLDLDALALVPESAEVLLPAERGKRQSSEAIPIATLRSELAMWQRPPDPPSFHLFFSYSHCDDMATTNLLYDCCTTHEGIDLFLDHKTISVGDSLSTTLRSLSRSRVLVPIVSARVLRRLSELSAESTLQTSGVYLLLEWTFMALLHKQHNHRIVPVFVGADADGNDAFDALLFKSWPPSLIPDVTVAAVHDELSNFYQMHQQQPLPKEVENLSAGAVVRLICDTVGGLNTWDSTHISEENDAMRQDWGVHEWIAHELVDKANKAPSPAPPAFKESVPNAAIERLLELTASNTEMMGKMDRKIDQVILKQETAIKMLSAQSKMLATSLLGTKNTPKLIMFLPPADNKSDKGKGMATTVWAKLTGTHWFKREVRVFFVDPIDYTVAQTNVEEGEALGFEVNLPREWVCKAMPYIKLGLTCLRVAAAAGKLSGVGVPDVGAWIDSQLTELNQLKNVALEEMSGMTYDPALARELLDAVDTKCEELLDTEALGERCAQLVDGAPPEEKLREPLQRSAEELNQLLEKHYSDWKDRCGLVHAIHTTDSGEIESEWVAPKHEEKFEAQGRAMMLAPYEEGAAMLYSSRAPPVALGDEARVHAKSKGTVSGKLSARLNSLAASAKAAAAKVSSGMSGKHESSEEKVVGLRGVLAKAKVRTKEVDAVAWFDENGLVAISDLKVVGMEEEFVAALKLRTGQHKLLLKVIEGYVDPTSSPAGSVVAGRI